MDQCMKNILLINAESKNEDKGSEEENIEASELQKLMRSSAASGRAAAARTEV